jgi:GxxExxY protein
MHEELTERIIGAAMKVHSALGPGLLESVYEVCLAHELSKLGYSVIRQREVRVEYDGLMLETGFRLDLLVNDIVIVEIKSVDKLHPIHEAQLLTHLRLSHKRIGLLINFNVLRLVDGIKRRVL